MTRHLGVTHHEGRTFDWNPNHDPESRNYGVRRLVEAAPTKPVWWTGGPVTDQGAEGACAGHAAVGEFLASPVRGKLPVANRTELANTLALAVYNRAKLLDPWPGVDYDGTSTNAVMKVGRERGWWGGYSWAFSIEDVRRALLLGPVVLGIPWYEGMYETRGRAGEIVPGGQLVGGHAILATGWTPDYAGWGPTFRLRNSWSTSYGRNGNGYIREAKLAELLAQDGEAVAATQRAYGLAA